MNITLIIFEDHNIAAVFICMDIKQIKNGTKNPGTIYNLSAIKKQLSWRASCERALLSFTSLYLQPGYVMWSQVMWFKFAVV